MKSRSRFVTVLAWLYIIPSAFALLGSFMQSVFMSQMPGVGGFYAGGYGDYSAQHGLFTFLKFYVYSAFAISLFILFTAIKLLKRQNWARVCFVGILALSIVCQLAWMTWALSAMNDLAYSGYGDPAKKLDGARAFTLVSSLLLCGLYALAIKKLLSQEVVAEFSGQQEPDSLAAA